MIRRLRAVVTLCLLVGCSSEIGSPGEPLRILAPTLPNAVLNEPYNETIITSGGLRPYTFTLDDGALPNGIALQGGTLRGTPSELGSFSFSVSVSDANLASTFKTFSLTVIEVPPPKLTLDPPLTGLQGVTTLRGRVSEARTLQALRTSVRYDAELFTVDAGSIVASRGDVALLSSAEPGRLQIDVAFLGDAFSGDAELFRFDLVPIEPTTVFVTSETEFLFANRHHYERLEEGRISETEPPADEAPIDDNPNEGANP